MALTNKDKVTRAAETQFKERALQQVSVSQVEGMVVKIPSLLPWNSFFFDPIFFPPDEISAQGAL